MEKTLNKERTDLSDCIGGRRYQEDIWRSLMRGAGRRESEKMAFRAWRDRSFGNSAPHQTVQG